MFFGGGEWGLLQFPSSSPMTMENSYSLITKNGCMLYWCVGNGGLMRKDPLLTLAGHNIRLSEHKTGKYLHTNGSVQLKDY